MYEFLDGLRYTYYCVDDNGCDLTYWNSLDTSDAIPNPNPYTVDDNTLSIDLHFGNTATYTMGFRCDGQVVDFYYDEDDWVEGLHSTMFRLDFNDFNNDCLEPDPDDCLCNEEWDPVCGIDGNTYSNACFATCEYVVIAYEGECLVLNEEIEGRWHLVGYETAIMYQFVDTEPFAEAGLKYTIYGDGSGEFDDLDGDYTGGTPNPYSIEGDVITIDYHFGNITDYQMNFRCEGQVVDLYNFDGGIFTLYREFYDYSQCYSMPNECFDLSEIDFGDCEMYLGVGWDGFQCIAISGCDWIVDGIDYSEYFYDASFDCLQNCRCEDGEFNNDDPCNPMECINGQWFQIVIDCAEEMGVPCDGGLYIPPPEGVCCSECVSFGDLNNDSLINILDVIEIISLILNNQYDEIVDLNYDGVINVLDVIEIIQLILD